VSAATAPTTSADPSPERTPGRTARVRGRLLVAAALVLSALSLLLPWALAFDPAMWLVWGRDITRLTLDTRAGPSWKPGPVLLTAPFSLVGGAAPALWLVVARAGALLALAGAATLGRRLAGPWAGAAAAAAIALSPWWLPNAALGNSEGILAAAVLWAIAAHLAGHRRAAVLLGLVAALLRPEVWPFLGLYGLWAWRADPRTRPALILAAVAVPVLWFGPDVTGAGGALGASDAARGTPSEGSAKLAAHPVLALLWDAVKIGGIPAFAAAVLAPVIGTRGRDGAARRTPRRLPVATALLVLAAAWVAIVAVMTAAGYAGNPRYLVAAAALFAVLAGAGAVWMAGVARLPAAAALVLPLAVGALAAGGLRDALRDVGVRADRRTALPRVIDAAGGRDALLACGPIRTAGVVRGLVAWELDVTPYRIDARPAPPATVFQIRPYDGGTPDPPVPTGYRRAGAVPGWTVWEACRG
jgi:hypothetical protein